MGKRSVQQHITERPIVVLGFDGESVKDYFGKDCTYAYQQNVPATGWTPSGPA